MSGAGRGDPLGHDDIVGRVEQLCQQLEVAEPAIADTVSRVRARLREPLRIAIAGRVKAGKSTLLNALVGERLAPTDAGECTRIVTWYREGSAYDVEAVLHEGGSRPLRFTRADGALQVELGDIASDAIHHLEVRWPSARLARMTLVDTPGLESLDADRSARATALLGIDSGLPSEVDAVVYLMRHLHPSDRAFLDAFLDRSVASPSPVNAVAVLSRADEIGAGRLDALESAGAIADRYRADGRIRALCATVVPVAGLIAETGHTLREAEVAALRELRTVDPSELDLMLVSVDRFCAPGAGPLTVEARRDLLLRLGLFGVRYCLRALRDDPDLTASGLARRLVDASGLAALVAVLDEDLAPRAHVLKARSALIALRAAASGPGEARPTTARQLLADVERVEVGSHELAELRLLHLVLTEQVELPAEERAEVDRLTRSGEPAERLGLRQDAAPSEQQRVALERLEHWRTRAAHPLTSRVVAEACELLVQAYEQLYAGLIERG